MTQTGSAASLLHIALQDLHAGKRDQSERLPAIADAAGRELGDLLRALAFEVRAQAERIAAAGVDVDGPENLWISGILDDAERDAKSHQAGRLRDIALTGAVRKAKAAEIVSEETAIALADAIGEGALADLVQTNREEEIAADRRLKVLLLALSAE